MRFHPYEKPTKGSSSLSLSLSCRGKEQESYRTPTTCDHSRGGGAGGGTAGVEVTMKRGDAKTKADADSDASFHTMKLSKLEHETMSLRCSVAANPSTTMMINKAASSSSSSSMASSVLPAVIKTSVHCVKNLTTIFTNATEAAAAALVKPPTPQVMLKRLHLYTAAVAVANNNSNNNNAKQEGDVFNFDVRGDQEDEDEELDGEGDKPSRPFVITKSFSTPSACTTTEGTPPSTQGKTPNSLSPRFLKSAAVYNKKQQQHQQKRSRHLSDRSSERSSVCSDELSLSDDETLLLTPNGSNLLLTASPVMPTTRRTMIGPDGKILVGGVRGLFKSAFGQRPLLGSIEESLLQRRLTPKYLVSGFRVLLGASGGFCPKQLTIPAKTFFYELSGQSQTTPYMVSGDGKYDSDEGNFSREKTKVQRGATAID